MARITTTAGHILIKNMDAVSRRMIEFNKDRIPGLLRLKYEAMNAILQYAINYAHQAKKNYLLFLKDRKEGVFKQDRRPCFHYQ